MPDLKIIPVNFENQSFFEELLPTISSITRLNSVLDECEIDIEDYYDSGRGQYDASKVLTALNKNNDSEKKILFTTVDLFIPIFTFIFGLAELDGNSAIISTHRLKNEFYGLPPDPDLLKDRLLKETIHELGHLFGLRHCNNYDCVMASSTNPDELDVKGAEYCFECSNSLLER